MTSNTRERSNHKVDRSGPITQLTARTAAVQPQDMPAMQSANENDTLDQGSGDSDTI